MRSLITALFLGSVLCSAALAADTARITVTGEGTVEAKPDMATINLGVTTEGATAAEAIICPELIGTNSRFRITIMSRLR